MIKGIIFFLAFWAFVTGGIGLWRQMNGKEKWETFKIAMYGLGTAVVTFVLLTTLVVLF